MCLRAAAGTWEAATWAEGAGPEATAAVVLSAAVGISAEEAKAAAATGVTEAAIGVAVVTGQAAAVNNMAATTAITEATTNRITTPPIRPT